MTEDESPPQWFTDARQQHEAALVVGQRVRVDVGECPHFMTWHGTIEQGATGIVLGIDEIPSDRRPDHRYTVWFDRPLRTRRSWEYAAHELRVITHDEILAQIKAEHGLS